MVNAIWNQVVTDAGKCLIVGGLFLLGVLIICLIFSNDGMDELVFKVQEFINKIFRR